MKALSRLLFLAIVIFNVDHLSAQESKPVFKTLINANIVDVEHGRLDLNKMIIIRNDRIISVTENKPAKAKGTVIDIKNAYVVPGLIDAHVHVSNITFSKPENTYKHLEYFVKHGITTVRDAAGNAPVLKQAKAGIDQHIRQGADIFYSSFMAGEWYYDRGAHIRKDPYTPWEQLIKPGINLDSAMREAQLCGATGVKLYHSFDSDFLKQVIAAAKHRGLKVWGHAMLYPATPIQVAQAGMDVISHVYMLENMSTDTLLLDRKVAKKYKDSVKANIDVSALSAEMIKRNEILDATLCISADKEPWVFELVKKMHSKGVKIAAGTDQIVDLHSKYPRLMDELGYFVDHCGFTPAEALKSATLINAETIAQEKNIGSVTAGKQADLLIVRENPLADIGRLKDQVMVIKHGELIL